MSEKKLIADIGNCIITNSPTPIIQHGSYYVGGGRGGTYYATSLQAIAAAKALG